MARKIYTSGNYVIHDNDPILQEFAKGYTTYTYNKTTETFTIKETVGGSLIVTKTDLDTGNVKNEAGSAYTFNSFVTFLRENTGFKTAPGGSGATPIGATLLKTNQSVSYRTGDDGDIEAGRSVDFFTLPANNPFNNTNRFTDEAGNQDYLLGIVIDWSTYDGTTVLGYRRTPSGVAVTWDNAIDGALSVSIPPFTNGWRLTNMNELYNLCNFQNGNGTYLYLLQYAPFNINVQLWSSTTLNTQSSFAWYLDNGSPLFAYSGKTSTYKYIPCRTFTVSGTTLS